MLGGLAVIMMCMALIGGWKTYSPVPHWDMWDGTIGFMVGLHEGNEGSWWAQHNEHRIVLSRCLFWLDYRLFGGSSVFLIAMNFIIAAAACYVFLLFIQRLNEERQSGSIPWGLWFFVVALLFFWAQEQNLGWAFQSQFLLAQLLPLVAVYWLARSAERSSWPDLCIAMLFGLLSAGTMANGILAFPLMFVMSLFIRVDNKKRLALAAAAIIVPALYFRNYFSPSGHGSLTEALTKMPGDLIEYTLRYLGSPLHYMLRGEGSLAHSVSLLGGLAMAWVSLALAYRYFNDKNRSPYLVALIFFVAYIAATAFGTGGGRVVFGVNQALASRYTTPALMSWAALLVAVMFTESSTRLRNTVHIAWGTAIAGVAMLIYQISALDDKSEILSNKEFAALAVELQIADTIGIAPIYPIPELPISINEKAKKFGISPLDVYPYSGLSKEWGSTLPVSTTTVCKGWLDAIQEISQGGEYVRVAGWIFNMEHEKAPTLLRIVNADHEVVGFALTGTPRPDVAEAIHPQAGYSGFRGYMMRSAISSDAQAVGDQPACVLPLDFKQVALTPAK